MLRGTGITADRTQSMWRITKLKKRTAASETTRREPRCLVVAHSWRSVSERAHRWHFTETEKVQIPQWYS